MRIEVFENVKDQIGYCGIWCGSCAVGNGSLKELTKRYDEIIKSYDLEHWAPKDFNFKEFKKGLSSIATVSMCQGCLKGGGRTDCEIRACALNNNLNDCSECILPNCENSEILNHMRSGARDANLFVKSKDDNSQELIKKWSSKIKSKWPHYVLFLI